MFELNAADYIPLVDCPIHWRWTDPVHCKLPAELQSKIRPLCEMKSKEAWKQSLAFVGDESMFSPNLELLTPPETFDTSTCEDESAARWLRVRMGSSCEPIVLNWQPNITVVTTADLFCTHWSTFCYPASDDLSIWPNSMNWVIHYWHEERLYFSRKKI